MSIERLDPRVKKDVEAISQLHEEHLPDSPILALGTAFVRQFFYTRLVSEGLIECTFCRADERIVGFISYTSLPYAFMGHGIRRGWPQLISSLAQGVITRPATLPEIYRTLMMMRQRREESQESHSEGLGEVISLVALPEYQKYVPVGGKSRLTARLFEEMLCDIRAEGCNRVRLLVKPENRASNLFCAAMGCNFRKVQYGGVATHEYTYHLNGRPEADAAPA
jgi:hypothetical protein